MRSSLLAVVCAAAIAACGPGSTSSPPPPPGGGDGGTGGGTTGGGSGGGGSGGQPSGGGAGTPSGGTAQPSGGDPGGTSGGGGSASGGGGTTGDAGSGGGSTTGGGSGGGAPAGGGTGGGTPPAGPVASHDGTVSIERLDADPECDGLLPASAPDAVSVRRPSGSCSGTGISDGTGHVAVETGQERLTEASGALVQRQAFTPDGQPEGLFTFRSVATPSAVDGTPALPQPRGWLGLRAGGRSTFAPVELLVVGPDGNELLSERIDRETALVHEVGIAEDPFGGALVWQHWHGDATTPGCAGGAQRYDGNGTPRGAAAQLGGCFGVGAAVSRAGEALVLEQDSGAPVVNWIAADGTPARPPVADPTLAGVSRARLAPLLDGTIAVDVGSGWTRRYPHLADRSEPAPGWLAAAPPRFRNTRGNRGYAFFAGALGGAPPASAECSQRLELRAPSGRLCGAVTLKNPGGACTPGLADQGWDGTVVERNAREPCAWRWWPRLLGD